MRRAIFRRLAAVAASLVLVATVGVDARAEPTPAEKETARGLVEVGDQRSEAGDLEGALKAYRAAHAIMNVPTTGIELAKTLEKLGHLTEARDVAFGIGRANQRPGEPSVFAQARLEADKLSERVEPKIPSLIIQVHGAPEGTSPKVTVDRAPLPDAALGLPRRVDPGTHVVTASIGKRSARVEVVVAEGEQRPVTLVLQVVEGASEEETTPGPRSAPPTNDSPFPWTAFAFGSAGVGFTLGAITGIASLTEASSAKENCHGNVCPAKNQGHANASSALAVVSDLGFGVAVLGGALGAYRLMTDKPTPPAQGHARVTATPIVGPAMTGGALSVRF